MLESMAEKERGEGEMTVTPGREGPLQPIHSGHHVSSERGKEASFSSQQRKSGDQITQRCSAELCRAAAAPTRTGRRLLGSYKVPFVCDPIKYLTEVASLDTVRPALQQRAAESQDSRVSTSQHERKSVVKISL